MTPVDEGKTASAYRVLRDAIVSNQLAPSSPLRLNELTKVYGFGWTPLREALSRLEAEVLVVSERNRGYFVAPVTIESLEDLQRARFIVEKPLLEEAIECGGEAWENEIVAAHYHFGKCALPFTTDSKHVAEEWEKRHMAFHKALFAAARSPWLFRMQEQILTHVLRHHRALGVFQADSTLASEFQIETLRRATSMEHHTMLMQATLDRDAKRAIALLDEHVGFTAKVFRCRSA